MSHSNGNASASSSRAPQQTESNSRKRHNIPVPTGTPDGKYLEGKSTFEGKLVDGSYTTAVCRAEDERVQFKLDDGRIVGAEGKRARALRIWTGNQWYPEAIYHVTLHGQSSFIKRVELPVEIKGSELEEALAEL